MNGKAPTATSSQTPIEDRASALRRIETLLEGLRFGSIEIVVHEGRIVQIERREKLRLS
jgi:hypothetical protein